MSLLKEIVQLTRQQDLIDESAAGGATAAGSVAGFRGHFFSPTKKRKKKKTKMRRRKMPTGLTFGFTTEGVEDNKFDSADVISKLKTAEKRAEHEEDTTGFALEDEEGRIVKVFVAAEEAKDFEAALGAALAGADEDDADIDAEEATSLEIAEVLFNLKDRFTIVDVEWPQVEEDEEEQEVEGEPGDAEGDLDVDLQGDGEGGEGGEGGEDEAGMEAALQDGEGEGGEFGDEMGGEDDAKSALDSVIDLLKAQADAQKAEANAKEAEANAEEAKYNSKAADSKVKQEEEVLDMEAHYDRQGKVDKEAKQLSKLAKWKHETAQDAQNAAKGKSAEFKMPQKQAEENEEYREMFTKPLPGDEIPGNKFEKPGDDENRDHRLQPGEFIKYMFRHVQGN